MAILDPAWANAISSIESGGNYGLLGPLTKTGDRAYGKYQVMGSNIGPWTKEVLGVAMSPKQFLSDKDAQDKVFAYKFGQSVDKYGNPQDAASVWFTGQPLAQGANRSDVLGTTGAKYVQMFNAHLGNPVSGPPQPNVVTPTQTASLPPSSQTQQQATAQPQMTSFPAGLFQPQVTPQLQQQMPALNAPQLPQALPMQLAQLRTRLNSMPLQQVMASFPAAVRGYSFPG